MSLVKIFLQNRHFKSSWRWNQIVQDGCNV